MFLTLCLILDPERMQEMKGRDKKKGREEIKENRSNGALPIPSVSQQPNELVFQALERD